MLNDHARRVLDPGDQVRPDRPRHRGAGPAQPGRGLGRPAQRRRSRGCSAEHVRGQPVRRRRGPRQAGRAGGRHRPRPRRPGRPCTCPGLVGSGVLWLRACREAENLYDSSDWIDAGGRDRCRQAGPGRAPCTSGGTRPRRSTCWTRRRPPQDWLTKAAPRAARRRGDAGDPARRRAHRQADARAGHRAAGGADRPRGGKPRAAEKLRVAITLNRKRRRPT